MSRGTATALLGLGGTALSWRNAAALLEAAGCVMGCKALASLSKPADWDPLSLLTPAEPFELDPLDGSDTGLRLAD